MKSNSKFPEERTWVIQLGTAISGVIDYGQLMECSRSRRAAGAPSCGRCWAAGEGGAEDLPTALSLSVNWDVVNTA